MTRTFSPSPASVHRVLPRRPALWAMRPSAAARMCAGRAVILFEPDDLRAGKVLLEAQDVGDLGAAPRIDRLVVVADAAQVAARLGEQLQPFILGAGWCPDIRRRGCSGSGRDRLRARRRGVRKIDQHVQQQVAEVAGVQGLQPLLVCGVELGAAAGGEGLGFAGVDLRRGPAAVLPAVDQRRRAGAPASASRRGWRR